MLVDEMRKNDGDIGEIQCRSCDVKDSDDGLCGSDADEVQADAEKDDEPDGIDGGAGVGVYLAPEAGDALEQPSSRYYEATKPRTRRMEAHRPAQRRTPS